MRLRERETGEVVGLQRCQVHRRLAKAMAKKTANNRGVVVDRRRRQTTLLSQIATEFLDNLGLPSCVCSISWLGDDAVT